MNHPIRIPRLNANDDQVLLGQWLVADGDYVTVGTTVCMVETSKAVHEIAAGQDGYIHIEVPDGQQVDVQAVIGHLSSTAGSRQSESQTPAPEKASEGHASTAHSDECFPRRSRSRLGLQESDSTCGIDDTSHEHLHHGHADASTTRDDDNRTRAFNGGDSVRMTHKARVLAEQMGLDVSKITHKGILREKDIRAYANRQQDTQAACAQGSDQFRCTTTALPDDQDAGRINEQLLSYIRKDRTAFGQLSSDFKIWLYRSHGAVIGNNVTIGPGVVIDAETVVIGEGSSLGDNAVVQCRRFVMGQMCEIGADSKVLCRDFVAGNVVVIRFRSVFVGGGMHSCRIGDNTFIAYDTYINTDRDVTIGRHVCLSPGAKLFTHRKWLSPLQGYSTGFGPVIIGDHCHIGPNVILLPGVRLGHCVTVMANSVVSDIVEADQLIGGVPAKALVDRSVYHRQLTDDQRTKIALRVLHDAVLSLQARDIEIRHLQEADDSFTFELVHDGATLAIQFTAGYPSSLPEGRAAVLSFDASVLDVAGPETTAFDLNNQVVRGRRDAVGDLLRDQLGRLGVEFEPMLWRPGMTNDPLPETY